jgi:transmembrane sensor
VKIEPVKKPDGDIEQIHETAWTQNRLVIDNQSFLSLQPMLERWFDINIVFKDEESKAYVFTATFEKETPEEVFSALQLSYPFHFSIINKTIYVSK